MTIGALDAKGNRLRTARRATILFAGAACTAMAACADGSPGAPPHQERGTGATGVAYVADATCAECHQAEQRAWSRSHHDLAMQPATAETVRGDFGDAAFSHFGVTSRFFTRDGRFFVNTEGRDGQPADFELTHTFGVEPLQQYLAPFPGGRLQSLPIAWDTVRNEWFHLYPDERIPPDDPLHWTGRYQTWNTMCAECHSTHVRKNYDLASDTYRTVWDAIDVGCQACHGPGESHVAWARSRPDGPADAVAGLVVDLDVDSETEIQACAGCHSRRQRINHVDRHAQPFLDDFLPSTLRDGLYHPDGQIRAEVYVWGSFTQSRMHRAGVRCSDCHDPHSLDLAGRGNGVCQQCHREAPVERFPALRPGRYDTQAHHFHEPGSPGAQCVSCHMPATTYMVVDPRRDHSFRVPRPDVSVALGTPNACTRCHTRETDEWAAARVVEWWGARQAPHFAEVFAAARRGDPAAEPGLRGLAGDADQPPIVRATAVEHLGQFGPRALEAVAAAATDADPLVRAAAAEGLARLEPRRRTAVLAPLLDDPIRAVRIEAARALAPVRRAALDGRLAGRLGAALDEFVDAQAASADMPGAHFNLGLLQLGAGDPEAAETHYRTALRLDPRFAPARFNLVNLLDRQGRTAGAEAVLREGIEHVPREGELHYSLGLLLAADGRMAEAAASLGRAASLLPARGRVRYNYGLVLQRLGRLDEAEAALVEANRLDPGDADALSALAQLLLARAEFARAHAYARALQRLDPTGTGPQRLLDEIRRRQGQP